MQDFGEAFGLAFQLVATADRDLIEIVALSLKVSLSAVVIACVIGLPLGATIAISRFAGRSGIIILTNALMGLPPVVVGLVVYLMLSNGGPLGSLRLLYTQWAMIIAQAILITPIITALSRQVIEELNSEYEETFTSLCVPRMTAVLVLLRDARFGLVTVALAGFGRAIAEVGAVIVVGGNINHVTRVMTTAIALETSKGDLALALALGIVLMVVTLAVNAGAMMLRSSAAQAAHA